MRGTSEVDKKRRHSFVASSMPTLLSSSTLDGKLHIFGSKKRKGTECPLSASDEDSVGVYGEETGDSGLSLECNESVLEDVSGESESVFSSISNDVLLMILRFTSQEHWASASLVCRRWNAVGRVAFNEFKTAKSFMHALFFDPSRLVNMADNPMLSAALTRNDEMIETVCQKVTSPRLLGQWVRGLAYPRWMRCLIKALQHGNRAAIVALFRNMPPSLSREQMCDEIVTRALAQRELVKTQSHMWLLEQMRLACPSFFESTYLVVSCCLAKQDELLCSLLKEFPDMFGPDHLLYILNHAADQRNVMLLSRVFASPLACRIVPGPQTVYLAKKLCKLGWTNAANHLLPPPPSSPLSASPPLHHGAAGAVSDVTSMLRLAAIAGQVGTVKMLLERQDVKPGMRNNVIIREAMEMGHQEVVLELLRDPSVTVFPAESSQVSLLCCAMHSGQGGDVIQQLVDVCPPRMLADFVNQFNHAPVKLALRSANREALARLFALSKNVLALTRDEVHEILALVGGMSEYSDMASHIIHDKRFARYFDWNR